MSDEHYGKILHSFWTDPRIKRRLSRDAKLLLCYYFSSPHKNMAGLYHCPVAYVADETGLEPEAVRAALQVIKDWVTFDPDTDEVFVHGLAETGIGSDLKAGDTKRKTLERYLQAAHSPRLLHLFAQRYGRWGLRIPLPEQRATPSDTPSDTPCPTPADTRAVAVAVPEQEQRSSFPTETGDAREQSLSRGELLGLLRKLCAPRSGKISEPAMRTNASCLDTLAGRKWSYADIHQAATGTRSQQQARDSWQIHVRSPASPASQEGA